MMLIISVVVLVAAYLLYGRYLARTWGIDPAKKPPSQEFEDGEEFVPTSPAVVFGHQFASIAGAGPINGPIIAAMFGWLPVLLWLLVGAVFFGAAHDFIALYTSVRNKGKSIGYVIELYVGKTGKRLFLIFVWLFSILIIAAFADIVAGTFSGIESGFRNRTNAQVASASGLFILAALGLGFLITKKKASDLASGIIAVDLLIACIVLGILFPVFLPRFIWLYLVFAYILIASVTPVWLLGQPRNYLSSFLLIAMVAAAFLGVVFTAPALAIPAFAGFEVDGNYLFPTLFITVACGAISGFHSMVSARAASKQINNEKYMLPVSYGAMLVETLVAILALIAVGSLGLGDKIPRNTPPVIFATAVSGFLHQIGLPIQVSFTIVSLAISSFVLTTLDTVARLGRLSFQELFSSDLDVKKPSRFAALLSGKPLSAIATLGPAYFLAVTGYQKIWTLFGAANQLLAALTLIACLLFLKKTRRRFFMLLIPTVIMLAITFTSLALTIRDKLVLLQNNSFTIAGENGAFRENGLQLVVALLLLVLGIMVAISCLRGMGKKNPPSSPGGPV